MSSLKITPIIISLLLLFASCKKDSMNESSIVALKNDKTQIKKIKDWYVNQKANHMNISGRDSTEAIPTGDPEWDSTHTYSQPLSTDYVVPVRFDEESAKSNQFIIVKTDSNGNVINGEYVFLALDSSASNNFTKEALETLTPETFDYINIPSNLHAWIIKYDLNYNPISAKYLSNGTAEDKELRFKTTTTSKAPIAQCENPVTIEWYWQIWINGELVYEEYLFSTTECSGGGSGGGGGSGNGNTGQTCQNQQNLLNQGSAGSAANGPVVITQISQQIPENRVNTVIKDFNVQWTIFDGTIWYIISHEYAVVDYYYDVNTNAITKEFSSFTHTGFTTQGYNLLGISRTYSANTPTIVYSGSDATEVVNFTVTTTLASIPGLNCGPLTKDVTYTSTGVFNANSF